MISGKSGNKFSLTIILLIWMAICVSAYVVTAKNHFYVVIIFIGLVMGGVQSLSRSTYAKLLPEQTDSTASYFSFYDILEKMSIVTGTLVFGFIDQLTGGMRNSILSLTVFFVVGLIFLQFVKMEKEELIEVAAE